VEEKRWENPKVLFTEAEARPNVGANSTLGVKDCGEVGKRVSGLPMKRNPMNRQMIV